MGGAKPPLPNTSSWRCAQLNGTVSTAWEATWVKGKSPSCVHFTPKN
jgi:hypothetical protein